MSRYVLPVVVLAVVASGCASEEPPAGTPGSGRITTGAPAPAATTTAPPPDVTSSAAETPPARSPALDGPLIRAAGRGDADRVRTLLARGASVRARNDRGETALVAAAYGNHLEAAELLLAAGADPNRKDETVQSAYLIATSEVGDDPRLLSMMLAAGGDVASLDSFDGTGLIRAADRGFPAVVTRLLETDIVVDHVNNLGWTALHETVILGDGSRRYVEVLQLLIEAGADVDKPSRRDGVRPLQHATERGFDDIARVLRRAGAR